MEPKLIQSGRERNWYLIKEWTTRIGLKAMITQCVWNRDLMPVLSLHDHYCGYVILPEGHGKNYYDSNEIEVHGGVTHQGSIPGFEGIMVGFDMAHYGDEDIKDPLQYCKKECESLAKQIAEYCPAPSLNPIAAKIFPQEAALVAAGKCAFGEDHDVRPETFRDELSRKEFGISGMCQKCQDETFGV